MIMIVFDKILKFKRTENISDSITWQRVISCGLQSLKIALDTLCWKILQGCTNSNRLAKLMKNFPQVDDGIPHIFVIRNEWRGRSLLSFVIRFYGIGIQP